ncbi:two component, sigma54 specific, transcriptional regulator, Fis family [Leucobacter sp. 7(1)]|nr:two component, sigma54 specific, transcriptional regulator, Fis family [Leucobacter sp. 7(1)]
MPDRITSVPVVAEEELDDTLLDVLHTPMTSFARSLDGTGVGLLLADAHGRILERWAGGSTGMKHLDRVGTVRGSVLSESVVGTNGVGTVLATRRPTQIVTNEHFSELYRAAICTGAPIFHPVTQELLGAVTLSCDTEQQTQLLQALIQTLTMNLEHHMLTFEQPGTRLLLDKFLRMSRQGESPLLGFDSAGLLVQNASAARFSPEDLLAIQQAAATADARGHSHSDTSAGRIKLLVEQFPGAGTVLVRVTPDTPPRAFARHTPTPPALPLIGKSPGWRETLQLVSRTRTSSRPLLISGEAASGKTSLALGVAYDPVRPLPNVAIFEAAALPVLGMHRWFERLEHHLSTHQRVILRNIDALENTTLETVRSLISSHAQASRIALTATVQSPGAAEALALNFGAHLIPVPPLRTRENDIAALWERFADAELPGSHVRPSSDALTVMRRHSWPGNLRELQTVVADVVARKRFGIVEPEELPVCFRTPRSAGLIEQAEAEAIKRALHQAGGNRVRAAEILGISRATVYRKMKSYRLSS